MSTQPRKPHAPSHHPRWWSEDRVKRMYAMYIGGAMFTEVAREFGITNHSSVRQAFVSRGWSLLPRPNGGRFVRSRDMKTPAQVNAIIRRQTRLVVPADLAYDWRHWSLGRRAGFLRKMREHLADPRDAPRLPYSSNVVPFDYTSIEAREIADKINAGATSQQAGRKLNLRSQGVIYDGRLWFWTSGTGYVYRLPGGYVGPTSQIMLHRHLWEQAHGPLAPGQVVRTIDGNPNNLTVENLCLVDRDTVCRENHANALRKKAEAHTAALLRRINQTPTPEGN